MFVTFRVKLLSNLEAVAYVRIGKVKKIFIAIEKESWGEKRKNEINLHRTTQSQNG